MAVAACLPAGPAHALTVDEKATNAARCPVVELTGRADGFTAPATVTSGAHTFRVTTADPRGIVLGLFRLNTGVRLDEFLALLRVALTGSGREQVEAGNAVARLSTLLGGISTVPGRPATFTTVLRPGTYHLIDYQDILSGQASVTVRRLDVAGRPRACLPPPPEATIEMLDTPDGPRYRAPATLQSRTSLLEHNRTAHVNEAVFMPINPDATADDVRRFFEALDNNQPPPSIPFTGQPPQGLPAIHGHLAAIIQPNLAPERYALMTWFTDENGRHHAARGMVAVVTVR